MTDLGLRIIGISGTNGSGKDTVSNILADLLNYKFISVSQFLRQELLKQAKEINRENTRELSNHLEIKYGKSYLVEEAINQYKKFKDEFGGLVVSSIRNTNEASKVKSLNGIMVWVDADPEIRYQRIKDNLNRDRPADDDVSFSDFLKQENEEMAYNKNNQNLNTAEIKIMCDITILNNNNLGSLKKILTEKFLIKSN